MSVRNVVLTASLGACAAHMGVSDPKNLDMAIGDVYRNPVAAGGMETNGGACHGHGSEAKYAWIWSPALSGQCEIYMNCWSTLPEKGTLKMSGGASHGGGPCKLYECTTGAVTVPDCDRGTLPSEFGTCKEIADGPECATIGFMDFESAAAGIPPVVEPVLPPPTNFPTGGTPSKIRCGSSWNDAAGTCQQECLSDADCNGKVCFADVGDCAGGVTTPVMTGVRPVGPDTSFNCVSRKMHVTDAFCRTVGCSPVYRDYCSSSGRSAQGRDLKNFNCEPYATFEGETWQDIAFHFDLKADELKAANPNVPDDTLLYNLVPDTVLELPGDCDQARKEVGSELTGGASSLALSAVLAASIALALL